VLLQGENVVLLAYGASSTGKSYTLQVRTKGCSNVWGAAGRSCAVQHADCTESRLLQQGTWCWQPLDMDAQPQPSRSTASAHTDNSCI
jgi:hypothetical protein